MAFRFVWLVIGLAVTPALATGQSLGDVAKKEQERREKLRKAGGTTKTLTETDLANTKGAVVNPSAAPAGESGASDAGSATPAAEGAANQAAETPDELARETPEEHWQRRVAHARARVRTAQQRHDYMQAVLRQGQPVMVDENGRRVVYSNQQLKARADAAQAAVAAAQTALDNLLEEARRKGALPGWLR